MAAQLVRVRPKRPAVNIALLQSLEEECLSPSTPLRSRMESLELLRTHDVGAFQSTINTWRSMLRFELSKKSEEAEKACRWLLDALLETAKHQQFSSIDRMLAASTLFNNNRIEICYEAFEAIAQSRETDALTVKNRYEACLYLYYSESDRYYKIVESTLISVTSSHSGLTSFERYDLIRRLESNHLQSAYSTKKLPVERSEPLLVRLYSPFFFDMVNGVRERIVCAERLLHFDGDVYAIGRKLEVLVVLLAIASNDSVLYNARADALDVLLRHVGQLMNEKSPTAAGAVPKTAKETLIKIEKDAQSLLTKMGGSKNVYENAQNAHNATIVQSADAFVERLIAENGPCVFVYNEYLSCKNMIIDGARASDDATMTALTNALKRIGIDSAQFASERIDLKMLLVLIVRRIRASKSKESELMKRLIEELVDMSDTCSSGHLSRFVNVFTGFERAIEMSFTDQLRSNFMSRFTAAITVHVNRDAIMRGSSPDADEKDRERYRSFAEATALSLVGALHREFVDAGHMKIAEFDRVMAECKGEL